MTIDETEKERIIDRCIDKMPTKWFIGGECFKRAAILGKGSWAVAFTAKRMDPPSLSPPSLPQQQSDEPSPSATGGSSNSSGAAQGQQTTESTGAHEEEQQDWTIVGAEPPHVDAIAVKVIVKEAHSAKSMEKYPKREVEIMRRLSGHEHVTKLYAYWQDAHCFYLAMELCINRSLSTVIKSKDRSKVLPNEHIKRYLREMLLGCQYIHQRLVVHRDIKPDNVLLDHQSRIKIGDFGLSAQLSSANELLQSICGTPKYQAPEMIRKLGYSFPADIWAVGCILYRLWYQAAPFDGLQSVEIYEKLLSNHITYPNVDRYGRPMGEHELRVVRAMLKKNPKFRATSESVLADRAFFEESKKPTTEVVASGINAATATSSKTMPPLEHMMHFIVKLARSPPTLYRQRLNYAQYHMERLMPPYWIHQWNLESQSGMEYYQYNNPNLFGCTFRDQTRMLCLNQRLLVYNASERGSSGIDGTGRNINKGSSGKFLCFDLKDAHNQEVDLREKVKMLQAKRELIAARRHPRSIYGSNGGGGIGYGQVQLDPQHLDRLPWLEQRLQLKGNRRYLKANGYHLKMGGGGGGTNGAAEAPEQHLYQLGYLYGGTGLARANLNRPKQFLLDTAHNSLTVQRHNEQMYTVTLDFIAAGKCTATMRKFVQYTLRYINAMRNAEQQPPPNTHNKH